ncbi:cupredoxin domain-containing protein [Candidatus Pacearchaeota archaeon]|nr:cupredoxin domain-containing protein [Candidatus Pacearchaeota archaeon]
MKKLLIASIVLLVLGIVIISIALSFNSNESNSGKNVKTFTLTGENFKFVLDDVSNPDIEVNKGDLVKIEFKSTKGLHDWIVDEFNVSTSQVKETNETTFVEFVADKTGTFEYYCSVGQHRANGMKGKLIVK